ncbi:hypothetical protein MRX96_015120 [Rhipicephalus microplus]
MRALTEIDRRGPCVAYTQCGRSSSALKEYSIVRRATRCIIGTSGGGKSFRKGRDADHPWPVRSRGSGMTKCSLDPGHFGRGEDHLQTCHPGATVGQRVDVHQAPIGRNVRGRPDGEPTGVYGVHGAPTVSSAS